MKNIYNEKGELIAEVCEGQTYSSKTGLMLNQIIQDTNKQFYANMDLIMEKVFEPHDNLIDWAMSRHT